MKVLCTPPSESKVLNIEVKPNIGTEEDRQALWDNLDYIDIFATDHGKQFTNLVSFTP